MAKHRIVGRIKRKPGCGYYVDKNGYVREFELKKRKRRKGGDKWAGKLKR